MRWVLQPLLDLRRRDEQEATGALGRAVCRCQVAEAEAFALRRGASDVAAQALACGAGLHEARWGERLRLEAARLGGLAVEAEARARAEAVAVQSRSVTLLRAALRLELVERLEESWRRAEALKVARQAEAAIDDRPWRQRRGFSASGSETRPCSHWTVSFSGR
jgi:predicted ABC-type transport system involved in lysophospholipase L1 biosynthesis ATPase subunit